MKVFVKVLLFVAAAAALMYGIYQLLDYCYPGTLKQYYSPVPMDDDTY